MPRDPASGTSAAGGLCWFQVSSWLLLSLLIPLEMMAADAQNPIAENTGTLRAITLRAFIKNRDFHSRLFPGSELAAPETLGNGAGSGRPTVNHGLGMTMASEANSDDSGKTMSLHVGRVTDLTHLRLRR